VDIPVGDFTVYGQGYFANSAMASSGVDLYRDFRAGVRWDMTKMVALDLGYQLTDVELTSGKPSATLAKGLYAGAQLNF
jgi:hypothetical protein